jgi:hypothetical protein
MSRRRRALAALVPVLLTAGAGIFAGRADISDEPAWAATGFNRAVIAGQGTDPLLNGAWLKFATLSAGWAGQKLTVNLVGSGGDEWTLEVQPETGGTLQVGERFDTRSVPDATHAGLRFDHKVSPTCTTEYGQYRIRAIDAGAGSVAMDFDVRCNDPSSPAVGGWVSVNMPTGPIDPVLGGELVPVTPTRVIDTRNPGNSPVGPGQTLNVTVTGIGGEPVPSDALAVVANVTAVDPTSPSFLTVYPTGTSRPTASNLNLSPGRTVPNLVTVRIGTGGRISIFNNDGQTNVIVDVVGYFATENTIPNAGRFKGQAPNRLYDSRFATEFGPGVEREIQVAPPGTLAAVLNVTATEARSNGWLTVYPANLPAPPLASNLNYAPGDTVPNLVVVKLSPEGRIHVSSAGYTHVIVDLTGTFSVDRSTGAGRFVPIDPVRLEDTRLINAALGPQGRRDLGLVGHLDHYPLEVSGVVFNSTVTNTTDQSYLTLWPGSSVMPVASNLNWKSGETRPNLAMMPSDIDGFVDAFNFTGSTDLIVDAAGWFTA